MPKGFVFRKFMVPTRWWSALIVASGVTAAFSSAEAYQQQLSFGIDQAMYSSEFITAEQGQQYSQFVPSFQMRHNFGNGWRTRGDLFGVLPMSDGAETGVAIKELYFGFSDLSELLPRDEQVGFEVEIGRKKLTWSDLDSFYNLGLWEPLVRWDAANPVAMGLSGAFFHFVNPGMRATFFVTGVFLPDQQPAFQEKDGTITSGNRWFRAPVGTVELGEGTSDIRYGINKPEVSEVIFNPGYAARIEVGKNDGLFARAAFSEKPMNQFHLGIETSEIIDPSAPDQVLNPKIFPVVVRHQVATIETGFRSEDSGVTLSWTREWFENPELPESWEQTELIDGYYIGLIGRTRLPQYILKRTEVRGGYVERVDDPNGASSTAIEGKVTASTQRFGFEQLASFEVRSRIVQSGKTRLDGEFRYMYSIADAGEWVQLALNFSPDPAWRFRLGADVFGVPEGSAENTSFISTFRSNDRITGGLTYVF